MGGCYRDVFLNYHKIQVKLQLQFEHFIVLTVLQTFFPVCNDVFDKIPTLVQKILLRLNKKKKTSPNEENENKGKRTQKTCFNSHSPVHSGTVAIF